MDGLTLTGPGGTGPGAIELGNISSLYVYDSQTLDNAVIDLAGGYDGLNQYASPGNQPGILTLGADLTLNAAGSDDYLNNDTTTAGALLSYGTINVESNAFFIQVTTLTNAGLVNGGTAYLAITAASFVNTGIFDAGSANFQPAVSEFANDGTLEMTAGGYFEIDNADTFANSGLIDNAGVTANITANIFNNTGTVLDTGNSFFFVTASTIINAASATWTLANGGGGDFDGGTMVNDGLLTDAAGSNYFGSYTALLINNGTIDTQAGSGYFGTSNNTLINNGTFRAESGSGIVGLYSQTIVNNGLIDAVGSNVHIAPTALTNAGDIIISGTDYIALQSFANAVGGTIGVADDAVLYLDSATGWSNAGTITIGSGASLYLDAVEWDTAGSIVIAAGGTMYLTLSGTISTAQLAGISNDGTIYTSLNLDNTGQTLAIGSFTALGTLLLDGATIIGGVVQSSAAGLLINDTTLDGVTYQGTLDLSTPSTTLTAADGLNVTGSGGAGAGIANLGSASSILFNDTQTFDNATVTLANATLEQVTTQDYYTANGNQTGTLTLGAGLTIEQTGSSDTLAAGGYGGTIVNDGTIDGASGQLTVQPDSFVNAGEIDVASGDVLEIATSGFSIDADGTLSVQAGGTADVQTAAWTNSGLVAIAGGGVLHLHGTLVAGQANAVSDAGTILGGTDPRCRRRCDVRWWHA